MPFTNDPTDVPYDLTRPWVAWKRKHSRALREASPGWQKLREMARLCQPLKPTGYDPIAAHVLCVTVESADDPDAMERRLTVPAITTLVYLRGAWGWRKLAPDWWPEVVTRRFNRPGRP